MPEPAVSPIVVELARAVGETVRRDRLTLEAGTTLAAALEASVRAGLVGAGELAGLTPAVFGRLKSPGYRLHDADRIELLGPLLVDPKLARQRRVARKRAAQPKDKWRGQA